MRFYVPSRIPKRPGWVFGYSCRHNGGVFKLDCPLMYHHKTKKRWWLTYDSAVDSFDDLTNTQIDAWLSINVGTYHVASKLFLTVYGLST